MRATRVKKQKKDKDFVCPVLRKKRKMAAALQKRPAQEQKEDVLRPV